MKKLNYYLLALAMLVSINASSADWDGVPVPATPPAGKMWQLNSVSDGFNYTSTGGNRPTEFSSRWKDTYINGYSGPSATAWNRDHIWSQGDKLAVQAHWDATLPIIYMGCMTSVNTYSYPLYLEAKVQFTEAFLANDVWLLSADETQEIDFLEAYPSQDTALNWFDQRIHISNHVFIRSPFTDYQPKDEEDVYGTWYWEEDREDWRGEWVTVGVYWKDPWHLEYYINGQWVRTMEKFSYSYKDHTGATISHTRNFNVIDKYDYTNGTGLNKPMHIIINLEQQQWHSDANRYPSRADLDDANGKNIMWVDWIRLYDAVDGDPGNQAPSANAGVNQNLTAGTTTAGLSGLGTDADGDALTYSWSKVSGPAATISNGTSANASVSGLTNGSTYVFRLTVSDGSLSDTDDVQISVANNGNTDVIVIEAETFTNTNGTYNDGQVPLGVNNAGTNINWVNSGDYADYSISVEQAGEYKIEYQISTPTDNAQIQIAFNGTTASTDNVVNNGQWDSYQTLVAGSIVNLSAGSHNVRITASGSNAWQWNLDKITLTLQSTTPNTAPVANAGSNQTLAAGTTTASLSGSGTDADGDALTYSWSKVSGPAATISNGTSANASVSGLTNGSTYVFRLTVNDGSLTDTDDVQITVNAGNNNPGPVITIEAESFTNTGGTYNDGQVPGGGANKTANNINWVNNGDYMDYPVNGLEEGSYEIVYYISSPVTGSTISFSVDGGAALNTTIVPNNGQWDTYTALTVAETVNINAGDHTIRLTAGAQTWTWNLDKFTLQRVGDKKSAKHINTEFTLYPNPASNELNISLAGEVNENAQVRIYNSTGTAIVAEQISDNNYRISVRDLLPGMYILQVINGNEIISERFIKE